MIRHLVSLLLIGMMAFLAYGSSDSGSSGSSSSSSSASASSPQAAVAGETKRIKGDHRFGCSDREYFEKLVSYAVQDDNTAFSQGLAAGLLAGTCTMFSVGEEVYITDTAIFSGLVEVRKKGQTQEFWTNLEAVS